MPIISNSSLVLCFFILSLSARVLSIRLFQPQESRYSIYFYLASSSLPLKSLSDTLVSIYIIVQIISSLSLQLDSTKLIELFNSTNAYQISSSYFTRLSTSSFSLRQINIELRIASTLRIRLYYIAIGSRLSPSSYTIIFDLR